MISNNQYMNNNPSFDLDDLFFSLDDFTSPNTYDQYLVLQDEIIEKQRLSSSENEQEQNQISSSNNQSEKCDLICGVCGAPAYGYNFDQITCESCKAFFRRNALRPMPNLKCRFSGSCIINIHTRRQCTYCRLKKCFDINMRKDWIRTEEEKELRQLQKLIKEQTKLNKLTNDQPSLINSPLVMRKKKRLTIKSTNQDMISNPIYPIHYFYFHHNLSDDDRILLNNITNAYKIGADKADCSHVNNYTSDASLSQFINDESNMHGSLIYFYKYIPQFKQLDIEDQILLIKCNLINIIHLHHIIIENFQDSFVIGKYMSKWIDEEFHYQMSRTRRNFYRFMNYPLLLKVILIIFIFTINLSIPRGSSQFDEYKNKKDIYKYQNYYITLLWRYLNHLFDEKEAIQSLNIIVMQILHYQILMTTMENYVRQRQDHHTFHSLMQSVFGLS